MFARICLAYTTLDVDLLASTCILELCVLCLVNDEMSLPDVVALQQTTSQSWSFEAILVKEQSVLSHVDQNASQ